ncbi:hypothetical protein [Lactobacillus intestinalis]|uniref:hypothetical protein n=1 Tax=Lactobacillus intestinalis TaxID=151781 RepID=UPI001F5605C8|nr:hypothetical protein [Lactobacillus intestinalis]
MRKLIRNLGIFFIFAVVIFAIMVSISVVMPQYDFFVQLLIYFCVIDGLIIIIILLLMKFDKNITENYRNILNARKIIFFSLVLLLVMLVSASWLSNDCEQFQNLIVTIKFFVSFVTIATLYGAIQSFLHPGTLQIKIWGTPTYEKGGKLCIPSDFSINVHNYNKKAQKLALIGICKEEDEKSILKNEGWDTYFYLPSTLSTRMFRVPSYGDLETVSSSANSETYSISKKDMLNSLAPNITGDDKEYLKLKNNDDTDNTKILKNVNSQLEQVYKNIKDEKILSKLDPYSQRKCRIMFNENKSKYLDLCIVYYVVDNPGVTNNLLTKHFRVEV